MTKKNPQTLKAQYDAVISEFDLTQMHGETNKINERKASDDPAKPDYSVNPQSGLAYGSDVRANSDPVIEPEMKRFNFDLTEQVPKETLVKGKDSGRTPTFGRTDSTADKKVS
ncbi:MAG: hypothetical protein ABSF65_05595 [Candidatus Bathyarchaeia archaeon]|jgi:hypothetical protein